jgi:neutral ceramidase
VMAVLAAYACHPVVLSADNLLWTADYPHYVRATLEAAHPGAMAMFLTGCAGDANTGHSAYASQTLGHSAERTFATAERLGCRIGEAALAAPEQPMGDTIDATDCTVELGFQRRESRPLPDLAAEWRDEAARDPARRVLLEHWVRWAEKWDGATDAPTSWAGRVSVLNWGGVPLVALPGEIFAETGLSVRAALRDARAFVFAYADALPGYIPPRSEFQFGGYEVEEAHRYIGMPATFAPGSAEALAAAAIDLLGNSRFQVKRPAST